MALQLHQNGLPRPSLPCITAIRVRSLCHTPGCLGHTLSSVQILGSGEVQSASLLATGTPATEHSSLVRRSPIVNFVRQPDVLFVCLAYPMVL